MAHSCPSLDINLNRPIHQLEPTTSQLERQGRVGGLGGRRRQRRHSSRPKHPEQRVLPESFLSAREPALKGHEELIDAAIVELPFRSAALEERGR